MAIQNIEAAFDAAAADRGILPTNVDNVREAGEGNWPKWLDKEKPTELSNLTAPEFLKAVHSDVIKENTVRKADIRARDPDLMNAVEGYISQRKRRGAGLGHAEGLIFITTHPARNLVPREVTFRKKFGRAPPKIIQRLRETARSAAQARRGRRRSNPTP